MSKVELLLIRGLPGSGKTTMARKYAEAGYVHCEADQYFEVNGEYCFDGSKLRAAHDDCLRRAIAAMDAGRSVVVANTFTRRWEMEPYLKAAKRRGVKARIIEATGNWPNVHGVPADAIERMRARWEPADSAIATQAQSKHRPYNASGSLSEYGILPECDAAPAAQAQAANADALDAARYRWLRDREIPEWLDLWHQNPDRIDAAIDQAMKE